MRTKYFKIQELVSKQVYQVHGETAFQFFDEKLLKTIDVLRELINKPITINNWHTGGKFDERGFRSNLDSTVKTKTINNELYISAHITGQAVDFDVQGMTAEQVRQFIQQNQNRLPYNIRLERGVSWVHLDTRDTGNKIYFF